MNTFQTAVEELRSLPPVPMKAAADYIHQLKSSTAADRSRPLNDAFGCLTPEEADEMERAIAENCERIDASEW